MGTPLGLKKNMLFGSAIQPAPEFLILAGLGIGGIDKHAVMTAFDLVERIANQRQTFVIRSEDRSVGGVFDDRLGAWSRQIG